MIKVGVFDAKPYDVASLDRVRGTQIDFRYHEYRLGRDTVPLARGLDAVCAFVNDDLGAPVIRTLAELGVRLVALRCAGFNNVDLAAARGRIAVARVPGYSPYAVAEHALALLMTLNRRVHRAYNRTREHNFSLQGLTGFDLNGKTCGVLGAGRIGQVFAAIARGLNMNVLACDPYPDEALGLHYVPLDELLAQSDVLSLHCPLTADTHHIIGRAALKKMKPGALLINTSRGALIDSRALLEALRKGRLGGAALDVYEEEEGYFFEDFSGEVLTDAVLSLLLTLPNVLITSHQAFLTEEALRQIAETTRDNLLDFFAGRAMGNALT